MGASPIIAPPQSALSPPQCQEGARPAAQPSTARPQSRKSPKILQILLQTIRPFPRRKKDPPPNHQPLARNPENLPKSCKSCFRQSALSPPQKRPAAQPSTVRLQFLKIPQNPANPASDNPPFPRRKKDPPPNHQPLARNPENPPKSCKSCFRQSALSPPQKRPAAQSSTARPQSRKSPQILQILLQTLSPAVTRRPTINRSPQSRKSPNPASDNPPFPPLPKRPAAQPSTARPQSRKSPQNPANPASDNIHPNSGMHPCLPVSYMRH